MQKHTSTRSILTHTIDPWGGVKGQNIFLLKVVMLHIKLKGNMQACILSLHTSSAPGVGSTDQNFYF